MNNKVRSVSFSAALVTVLGLVLLTQAAQAQTFVPLHEFTGGQDGENPAAGLTTDRAGNLYGTTQNGGNGHGTVFKMAHKKGGWLFTPLYSFAGGNDGATPYARVIIGADGSLYGTTTAGGGNGCSGGRGCGTVFNVRPSVVACTTALCPWTETVLYRFTGGNDGATPSFGDLIFDQAGNVYGTTEQGGGTECNGSGCGTVFKLTRSSGGRWAESIVYSFTGANDGGSPIGGVIFDMNGNLYGTTAAKGSYNCGTVFQLTPSGSGWAEHTLYPFNPNQGDGCSSFAGLAFDNSGNLYGTNLTGGYQGGGTVFELMSVSGNWTETVLYAFTSQYNDGPMASLAVNPGGTNLFGTTTFSGAYGLGNVFKLTLSNGSWMYTSLHDFLGYNDGSNPGGSVILDANGNLYSTASSGGGDGGGVVFEITP